MRTLSLAALVALAGLAPAAETDFGLKPGTVELKSAGPIAFGPHGILFVADPKQAAIFAIDTGDKTNGAGPGHVKMAKADVRMAGVLGTTAGEVELKDMAINPVSGNLYFSVGRGRGPEAPPVLLKLNRQGEFSEVPLKDVAFAKATLPDPAMPKPGAPAPRRPMPAITGLAYVDGKVYVAGMSNEQFDSTFRAVPFPFADVAKGTTVEIYHGNHGKVETNAPIRSFINYEIAGDAHLLAAYTCTPLVKIPLKDIKPGAKIKGTTVAELGNRNTPLDMVVYNKGGKDHLLMINDNRGVMKIDLEKVGTIDGITSRVGGTAGLPYETIKSWQGVTQMAKLDNSHAVIVTKGDGGLTIDTIDLP